MSIDNDHSKCKKHSIENCDINDHHDLKPDRDDCGHTVSAGPGIGKPAYVGSHAVLTSNKVQHTKKK